VTFPPSLPGSQLVAMATNGKTQSAPMFATYGLFIMGAGGIFHLVSEGAFSSISTLSILLQCLGLALLALQVISTGSAAGISARTLILDAIALSCRLSSTLIFNGYLPTDLSGDYCFQLIDLCSCCILGWLIHQVLVVKRDTYQVEDDCLPAFPMAVAAFILAVIFHADMNRRPIFDTLWMTGLFVQTIAVLPQMWLITRTGGHVESLISHHIAVIATGRALECIFMWYAADDVASKPYIEGFEHAIWAILGAHLLHMLLLGDFAYHYIKAVIAGGLNSKVDLSNFCYDV
jgi:hypothetical protein